MKTMTINELNGLSKKVVLNNKKESTLVRRKKEIAKLKGNNVDDLNNHIVFKSLECLSLRLRLARD